MPGNRAVAYMGPGKVEVQDVDYPSLELRDGPGVNPANVGRQVPHGAILKCVATNICGSDQHMVRGRTTAPEGLVLGHEITGEVVEVGPGVEFIKVGDLCSCPSTSRAAAAATARRGTPESACDVNPDRPGSAYGYVDMGGWVGGQARVRDGPVRGLEPAEVPDKDQAMEKILDLAMLSDIFPTGYHGCVTAGVTTGSTVYVAGAGPVGLAAATSALLLGAAVVIVGRPERRTGWPKPRASAAKPLMSPRAIPRIRSSRSLAFPRSTARSMRSGSRPAATAARPTPNGRRPCSTP